MKGLRAVGRGGGLRGAGGENGLRSGEASSVCLCLCVTRMKLRRCTGRIFKSSSNPDRRPRTSTSSSLLGEEGEEFITSGNWRVGCRVGWGHKEESCLVFHNRLSCSSGMVMTAPSMSAVNLTWHPRRDLQRPTGNNRRRRNRALVSKQSEIIAQKGVCHSTTALTCQ
jgi:hypothetical protein